MSTAIESMRFHAETAPDASGPVFTKTTHYDPLGLPKMSSQTSLLDVIRSQGQSLLGSQGPLKMLEQDRKTKSLCPPGKHKTKPIRIASPQPQHEEESVEEDLMSSSAELERFYDQATWRMYILIQSTRLANDSAMGNPSHGRVPTTSHSHAPYHPRYSTTSSSTGTRQWTTQCPSAVESEEDIFDFEL